MPNNGEIAIPVTVEIVAAMADDGEWSGVAAAAEKRLAADANGTTTSALMKVNNNNEATRFTLGL